MHPTSPYAIVELQSNVMGGKLKVSLWYGGDRSEKFSLKHLNELVDLFNRLHGEGYRLAASNLDSNGIIRSYVFELAETRTA